MLMPPPSRSLPKKKPNRAMNVMLIPIAAAIDEIKMSRFTTCESSCASTPRSSRSSRSCRMPTVTATDALFGLRPVAKAFGCCICETKIFGIGICRSSASSRTIR